MIKDPTCLTSCASVQVGQTGARESISRRSACASIQARRTGTLVDVCNVQCNASCERTCSFSFNTSTSGNISKVFIIFSVIT